MVLMTEEPQTEEKPFKQDLYLTIAYRISKGEAGDFIYCLQDGKFYTYEQGVWREILLIELIDKVSNNILNDKGRKVMTKLDITNRKKVIENLKILKLTMITLVNFSINIEMT